MRLNSIVPLGSAVTLIVKGGCVTPFGAGRAAGAIR